MRWLPYVLLAILLAIFAYYIHGAFTEAAAQVEVIRSGLQR